MALWARRYDGVIGRRAQRAKDHVDRCRAWRVFWKQRRPAEFARCYQPLDACTKKATSFHEPAECLWWQRISVRRIHIEPAMTYDKILRIRSFQKNQTSRTQDASSLIQQCYDAFEGKMFD